MSQLLPSRDGLIEQAQAWLEDDPDEQTRAELQGLIEADDLEDLAHRFAGPLQFGTAGLRGAMGAGPNRMNRAVVIRAAAGLTRFLTDLVTPTPRVVIGFDARHGSDVFARDTAAVVTAAGGEALVLPRALPTPVLAFAIGHLNADAGVMVTASHNPPQDNGYKVYLGDGSQIVPPVDAQIAERIDAVTSVASVPRTETGWQTLGDDLLEAYLDRVASLPATGGPREVDIVHTSLHGVGHEVLQSAFARAGFPAPQPVSTQSSPDPDFPTVSFPNPEEPGAIDAALALASEQGADLVLANDPDADRCAVAVPPGPDHSTWRMLSGDQVGALLGWHLIERGVDPRSERTVLARSIVSSRLLGAIAEGAGLPATETLTGFKWIGRVPGLRFGYEEALGYCVDPATVPDKDGISAAVMIAELAAGLRAQGRTLDDVLDEIATAHGVYATDAFSVRVADVADVAPVMARLRDERPDRIADRSVLQFDDLSVAASSSDLPVTDGLRFLLDDATRVIVRPSGTEPKLKVYLEAVVAVPASTREGLHQARRDAGERLAQVRAAMEQLTQV